MRQRALVAVALLVLAGCTGYGGAGPGTTTDEGPHSLEYTIPEPPDSLDSAIAEEVAAEYQLALLAQRAAADPRIETVSLPEPDETNSTAVARQDGGVVVEVSISYIAYANETERRNESGMFFVTTDRIRRAAYPGPERAVEPYRGSGQVLSPLSVRLVNFGESGAELSVIVTHLEDSPDTALLRTPIVDSRSSLRFEDALAAPGTYRVTVSTENRTASTTVTYTGDRPDRPIAVYRSPDGDLLIHRR
jgi:hypothetical protein